MILATAFGVLRPEGDLEWLDRDLGLVDILGVVDVLHRRQRGRVRWFRQCGKHIGVMKPAPLLTGGREDLANRFPEAEGAIYRRPAPGRSCRGVCNHAADRPTTQWTLPRPLRRQVTGATTAIPDIGRAVATIIAAITRQHL